MSKLFDLLTDLALDPKKQNIFINNPTTLIEEVGLSQTEQSAITSKETAKVAALFTGEQAPLAISMADPGPDPLPDPDPSPHVLPQEPKSEFNPAKLVEY